jgi:hypothetical protein
MKRGLSDKNCSITRYEYHQVQQLAAGKKDRMTGKVFCEETAINIGFMIVGQGCSG